MHQIRKSVFETNSSSSHSLTLSSRELVASPFSAATLRRGEVELSKGEYGWEWKRYYSALEKMNYLFTQLFSDDIPSHSSREEVTRELRESNDSFDMLCRVVEEHTGVKVYATPGTTGYIDHQSVGVGLDAFESDDKLKALLFSTENYIETGNDNSGPAWTIDTDKGSEFYYCDFFWEPPSDNVLVQLKLTSTWRLEFETLKGAKLDDKHNADVLKELASRATVVAVKWDCRGSYYRFKYEDAKGYTASMLTREQDGMFLRLSPALEVETQYTKTEEFSDDSAMVTVSVPLGVANTLAGLRKTPVRKKAKTA